MRALEQHEQVGQCEQHKPQRLGPELHARNQRDAVHHQRHDAQRRQQIAHVQGPAETQLQGGCQDGRLQRQKDEREAGVDQRSERGAEVAEAGTARQQVHVDTVFGGVIADRQAGEKGDDPHHQDRPQRIREPVAQRNRGADGLQRQERDRPGRRVGNPEFTPFSKAARRIAQRVVLQRLVANPGVVVAPDAKDFLRGGVLWRGNRWQRTRGWIHKVFRAN